jgi:hypothetical protein
LDLPNIKVNFFKNDNMKNLSFCPVLMMKDTMEKKDQDWYSPLGAGSGSHFVTALLVGFAWIPT